ncbi:hypothetical protein N8K70_03980 [Microbacterium betulae]|uniref:Uncharacterized protein n=1 Tax=Microbacterium betulae TaxID=2981139 RepID=A0AA97I7V0_9MICO|nr:hypothetical protein [Microbacterium sp. AB]WOF23850.1 hypothetical protein N8K70_03980 [Microbacterium sp. AB]
MTVDDLVRRRPPTVQLPPTSAVVTAVTEAGVFATPTGQTADHPVGPCRGPRVTASGPLAPGMHVLLVFTSTGPWIVSVDE